MGLFGTLVQDAMGGFPKKPKVPLAPYVSAQDAQQQAIGGNQRALGGLETLAGDLNEFNLGEFLKRREGAAPGINRNITAESDLLNNWLHGMLSPDVASAVRQAANAHAFAGGYGGGGAGSMSDFLNLRNYGLTSQAEQQAAIGAMPGFVAASQAGMPAQYNPAAGFISPAEQIASSQWNEANRYGRDWLQNQLNSLPDPGTAAIAQALGQEVDTGENFIRSYFGLGGVGGSGSGGGRGGGGGGIMSMFGGGGGGGGAGAGGGAFFGM